MKRQTKKELRLELKRMRESFKEQWLVAQKVQQSRWKDQFDLHHSQYDRLLAVTRALAADCWGDEAAKRLSFALHGSTKVLPIL